MGDLRLILVIAATQFTGWGTMFIPFQLMVAPMEADLGWSRASMNMAFTLGLLVSGLAAVPVGRLIDRAGGRLSLAWGGLAGAVLLAVWSQITWLPAFFALWLVMGLAHAFALWGAAMAVMVTQAREPVRAITTLTFITGFTGTVFLPMIAGLEAWLGWRGTLLALAALQAMPVPLALLALRDTRPATKERPAPIPLGPVIRRPAFIGLALCLCAHAFIGTGLGSHLVLMLREKGLDNASAVTLVALQGPFQVAARAVLFVLGTRVQVLRVGIFACACLPVALGWLWLSPAEMLLMMGFVLFWAMADGLLTIVRAAAPAELLGREGYGAISGALTASTVLPRALAPAVIAAIWQASGGYEPVMPLLLGLAVAALAAFLFAQRDRRAP
ncbi:MFS transporter [Rhodovarius crocodyli]|uniref:MFS transporter n=1 Tax=Rhodovarius crocodyli TaxID=1979269 RepID=A0A437MGM2_9PROT|nr:MFS transporter [Rhodovarius crocodyli]RVT96799.1 MFS transporter [Rhodovarius crocodyli]